MTRKHLFMGLLLAASGIALAACGGGNSSTAVVTPPPAPPPVAAKIEDSFGATFAADYRTAANTEPTKPDAAGIASVSLTTEPLALHP